MGPPGLQPLRDCKVPCSDAMLGRARGFCPYGRWLRDPGILGGSWESSGGPHA